MNKTLANLAKEIRKKSLWMVYNAQASHIGSALSIADILAALYGQCLSFNKNDPADKNRDRFILSKGHACVALYSVLSEVGFLSSEDLETYGQDFSNLMNHVSHRVPGVEFSTGSLGHGLPFAAGKAKFAHIMREKWLTFVLLSDGEIAEGSNWEAILFAAHHKLENLVAIVDYNNLQSLTSVEETLNIDPLEAKFIAFGWDVFELDGHDVDALVSTLKVVKAEKNGKPKVIIAKTTKGKGVSFMENKVLWHYRPPNTAELKAALKEVDDA